MPPTVSIVTPVLEAGQLLERTVKSVSAQVGVAWELLLVGPSPSAVLPQPTAASRGRIRRIERAGGNAIELINVGLSYCRGDYVTWLMPGDVYYRDTLRVVAETFHERPDADLVYGDAVLFDVHDNPRGRFRAKPFSRSRLRRGCCFCQPAVFLRQGVYLRQGPLDDSLAYWSDYDYWLRLADAGGTFERTPQLLAGCQVSEATETVHLGPFARDILPEAIAELHAVFQRHLGRVPTRWLVHAGRVAALHDPQVPPELLPHFLATLRFARAAARECRQSSWGTPLAWMMLPLESARSEWRRLRRDPQPLKRVLPVDQLSQGVRHISGQMQRASQGVRTLLVDEPQRLAKGVAASTVGAAVAVNGATVGFAHRLRSAAATASTQLRTSVAAMQQTALSLTVRLTAPAIARGRKLAQTCLAYSKRRLFKLRNYDPRPLRLPAAYFRTTPPTPPLRISIVTPNLNQGRFLEATIRSVVDQDYPELEYIIQDGLSTDESVEVIRRYAPRLAYWTSEKDSGQANAINRGMRHATGDLLAYLNSDDLLLPGSLAYVARFFATHPEVDVVYGHRVLIDDDGLDIGRWVLPPHDDHILAYVDYVPQETMFWRRSLWERVGGQLDEAFHFAMDWDLILRFREAGAKFHRLPRFLGAFRISSDNKTTRLLETVGRRDMEILRQRVLGRIPSDAEIHQIIRPYMWRHWLYDKLYIAGVLRY